MRAGGDRWAATDSTVCLPTQGALGTAPAGSTPKPQHCSVIDYAARQVSRHCSHGPAKGKDVFWMALARPDQMGKSLCFMMRPKCSRSQCFRRVRQSCAARDKLVLALQIPSEAPRKRRTPHTWRVVDDSNALGERRPRRVAAPPYATCTLFGPVCWRQSQ